MLRRLVVVYINTICLLHSVNASGKLSVQLMRYVNPSGKGSNGACCDGKLFFCETRGCDHYFDVCVDVFAGSDSMGSCSIGSIRTGVTQNQDSIQFGGSIGGTRNPLTFSFTRWQTGAKLKIKVYDDDSGVNSDDDVDFIRRQFAFPPARSQEEAQWYHVTLTARTTLTVQVKAYCDANWYGAECSVHCQQQPGGHYNCGQDGKKHCHPGWTGSTCTVNIDECSSSPCLYGGLCHDRVNAFVCQCPAGFVGVRCEVDVDDCDIRPCMNGGRCQDKPNGYVCHCSPGWSGKTCEQSSDSECAGESCNETLTPEPCTDQSCDKSTPDTVCTEGQCSTAPTTTPCSNTSCNTGETSTPCTDNPCTDQTSPSPCTDTLCSTNPMTVSCTVEPCGCSQSRCENGGTCVEDVTSPSHYRCECVGDWTGQNCDVIESRDVCESKMCSEHGKCVTDGSRSGGAVCQCDDGWTGVECESYVDLCSIQPCYNNGLCVQIAAQYYCECTSGYYGPVCENRDVIDITNDKEDTETFNPSKETLSDIKGNPSAFVFSGTLQSHHIEHLVTCITNVTTTALGYDNTNKLTVTYNVDYCTDYTGAELSIFLFHAMLPNGSYLTWEALDSLLSGQSDNNLSLPLPISEQTECLAPYTGSNTTHMYWLVPLMVLTLCLLVVVLLVVVLRRRRQACRDIHAASVANPLYLPAGVLLSQYDDSVALYEHEQQQQQLNGNGYHSNDLYAEAETVTFVGRKPRDSSCNHQTPVVVSSPTSQEMTQEAAQNTYAELP